MTNKITKEFLFTELSIKIATLEMKLDKVLELLNKPEIELTNVISVTDHRHVGAGTFDLEIRSNPLQWPNESHKDYLKRIGQYNEASVSEHTHSAFIPTDEEFTEDYK